MAPATMDTMPQLTWENSANSSHPTTSSCLPEEVATCLQNARFLHLATCTQNTPHVSLMNYTYLPAQPSTLSSSESPATATQNLPPGPKIIMTTNPTSKKTLNLLSNPNVSLLVHDWVSSRPPNRNSVGGTTASESGNRDRSPGATTGAGGRGSSLANMLMQMNSAAVSSISATINGEALVLEPGSEEERWCKERHLLNNTFSDHQRSEGDAASSTTRPLQQQRALSDRRGSAREADGEGFGFAPSDGRAGDGGRGSYIEDEEVRVVVVRIRDGRISDWKGGVKEFVIRDGERGEEGDGGLVNGVGGSG